MCYDIKMANMKLSKSSVRSCNKIMPYPTNVKQLCIRWLLCTCKKATARFYFQLFGEHTFPNPLVYFTFSLSI